MRYLLATIGLILALPTQAQVDHGTINRIIDEALNQSEVPSTAANAGPVARH